MPIVLYAVLGTSRTLAVGPVAVVSLMTAATLGSVASSGSADYASAALTLAALSGGILILMGVLKLGFLINFISHPVIAGFITASGITIAASQLKHVFGVDATGSNLIELVGSLAKHLDDTHWITLALGLSAAFFLLWVRQGLMPLLNRLGVNATVSSVIVKTGPIAAVVGTTVVVWLFGLVEDGVSVVGAVPQSLPPLTRPNFSLELTKTLLIPAFLISIIGFVESLSLIHI